MQWAAPACGRIQKVETDHIQAANLDPVRNSTQKAVPASPEFHGSRPRIPKKPILPHMHDLVRNDLLALVRVITHCRKRSKLQAINKPVSGAHKLFGLEYRDSVARRCSPVKGHWL